MRNGPEIAAWDIVSSSPTSARAVQDLLHRETDLNSVHAVTVTGGGTTQEESHRLGDYFRAIRVEPLATGKPHALRVIFERHPHVGRYWRDLMVRILHATEEIGQDVKVEFAYRTEQPSVVESPPGRAEVA